MSKISPGVLSPSREILTPDGWLARGRARRIRPDHPVIIRFSIERKPETLSELRSAVAQYQDTPPAARREALRRYYFGDFARKVVGVGSVGAEAFVLLLIGDRDGEPLFRQVKEAHESVLARFAGPSEHQHQGERLARGQRMISGSEFGKAIAQFSVAYAGQNEKDYQALADAVATGRVQAVMGL